MKTIRAFIAVGLPEAVKTMLDQAGRQWAGHLGPTAVRWVKPEAMHLTIRFLGDTAVSQLPALTAVLHKIAAQHVPFDLQLDKLGCFPNSRRPRVIWAGLQGAVQQAQAFKQDLDHGLVPLGWEPENKTFQPHLTIGRVKESRAVVALPWGRKFPSLSVPVTAVHLIESQLRPAGPIYTVRHTSRL